MIGRLKRLSNWLSVIGCRCFLLITDYRSPITFCFLLLSVFFLSCGNHGTDRLAVVSNDSTPPDIRAIIEKINSDRGNSDLYVGRAKANFARKDFDAAIGDMKVALNIDSSKASYYIFLSDLYFTQNKTRDTRDMLRKAMKLDSTNAEAMMKYS